MNSKISKEDSSFNINEQCKIYYSDIINGNIIDLLPKSLDENLQLDESYSKNLMEGAAGSSKTGIIAEANPSTNCQKYESHTKVFINTISHESIIKELNDILDETTRLLLMLLDLALNYAVRLDKLQRKGISMSNYSLYMSYLDYIKSIISFTKLVFHVMFKDLNMTANKSQPCNFNGSDDNSIYKKNITSFIDVKNTISLVPIDKTIGLAAFKEKVINLLQNRYKGIQVNKNVFIYGIGVVIIGCELEEKLAMLQDMEILNIATFLVKDKFRKPRICIIDFPQNYFRRGRTADTLMELMDINNPDLNLRNHYIKYLFNVKSEDTAHVTAVFEVKHNLRKVMIQRGVIFIDSMTYTVRDFTEITKCHKCQQFGHCTRDCRNVECCSYCSEPCHDYKSCHNIHKQPKCANCSQAHTSDYIKCPNLRSAVAWEQSVTDYGN